MQKVSRILAMVGTQPRTEIVTVTPDLARKWLATNTANNRRVRRKKVDAYARDMTSGQWALTHQGIAFNKAGELVDGQHRLEAVIAANVPVQMVVSTGFDVEYSSPIDVGASRSFSDLLHVSNKEAAALRALALLSSGRTNPGAITPAEVAEAKGHHREGFEGVRDVLLSCRVVGIRMSGWVAGAIAFAWPLDAAAVANFAEQVRSGELLERGDPAYTLRTWLSREKRALNSYEMSMAALACTRAALLGAKLEKVHVGHTAYHWICQRRRALGVPHTPSFSVVPSL